LKNKKSSHQSFEQVTLPNAMVESFARAEIQLTRRDSWILAFVAINHAAVAYKSVV
jgi:hypothetical protein